MLSRAWMIVLGLIAAESGAQYFLQKAVKAPRGIHLAAGAALYVLVALLYFYLLRTGDPMALANSVWNAGTEVSIALVGWFFFKQKLGARQFAGIAIIMLGMHLLGA